LGFVNKFLNFCAAYFLSWFLKMAIILSHSHFLHVAFVLIMVFQTFDRMIFGTLTVPGTRWNVLTVRDPQMVRNQKKFGNHCHKENKFFKTKNFVFIFALNFSANKTKLSITTTTCFYTQSLL